MSPASRTRQPDGGDTIRRNTAFALAAQLATAGFTAILTVFLVRRLGPEDYGIFALALSVASLVFLPADFGISQSTARYVAEHFDEPLRIPALAKSLHRHPNYLMQVFKERCGVSIGDYLVDLRISNAQRLLATTDRKVTDIAQDSGFATLSRFYEAFAQAAGMAPGAYRSANRVRRPKSRYDDDGT